MAESLRAKFEEHLSCAICLEYLRDPRVLPCLHSYCRECLAKLDMSEMTLTCPECRDTIEVPCPPDVSFLPSNFFANNLLATLLLTKDSDSGNITCENCDGGEEAETRCGPCAIYLCHFCTESHRRSRKMKSHHLKTLEELKKSESPIIAQTIYCPKHEEESMKFYCKTCQETICRDCTVLDHRQHDYLFVQDIAEEKKSELLKLLHDVKRRKDEIAARLAGLTQKEEALNENNDSTVRKIESYFGNMESAIEGKKKEFISQARSSKDAQLKQLHIQREDLEFLLASCESNIGFTEQAFQNGNDVQLLNLTKYISKSLESRKDKKSEFAAIFDAGGVVFETKLTERDLVQQVAQNCFLRESNGDRETTPKEIAAASEEKKAPTAIAKDNVANKDQKEATVKSNTKQQSAPKQASTKDNIKQVVNPKSTKAATSSKQAKQVIKSVPSGRQIGDRTLKHGHHEWTIEIDHSCCPGYRLIDVEIGVKDLCDGTTVTLDGFIRPGRSEDFRLEFSMHDETLSVEPSWNYDTEYFEICPGRWVPFLYLDCECCDVTITEQNRHWSFQKYTGI